MPIPSEIDSGDGRRFKLKESDPADVLDLMEAAGSAAGSSAWMRYALGVCSVTEIDGVPVMMPKNKDGVRALARKIGNIGVSAIFEALYKDAENDEAKPVDPEVETAKN